MGRPFIDRYGIRQRRVGHRQRDVGPVPPRTNTNRRLDRRSDGRPVPCATASGSRARGRSAAQKNRFGRHVPVGGFVQKLRRGHLARRRRNGRGDCRGQVQAGDTVSAYGQPNAVRLLFTRVRL